MKNIIAYISYEIYCWAIKDAYMNELREFRDMLRANRNKGENL